VELTTFDCLTQKPKKKKKEKQLTVTEHHAAFCRQNIYI
jgi:hypothetical protein